jgi:transposase
MDSTKYVGMDVHKETISVAVVDSTGKLVKESILETKANAILEFILALRRNVHVTFEEGTWAAWLYDLLKPHVTKVVVCNPRMNAWLSDGNKDDRTDARKLAELLRGNFLKPVYHGETGIGTLKELTRSYLAISGEVAVICVVPGAGREASSHSARELSYWPRSPYATAARKCAFSSRG